MALATKIHNSSSGPLWYVDVLFETAGEGIDEKRTPYRQ